MNSTEHPDNKEKRLEHMVKLYQTPLLRLCTMYLRDVELAKDAVQETFIKAYRSLDAFRAEASEKTWLTRIAINTCKNIYRTAWFRHINRFISLDMLRESPSPTRLDEDALTEEILNLPYKLREVALLCWLQGVTQEEAASILGISRQAVGGRLQRARKKLRFAWEGSDTNDSTRRTKNSTTSSK